MQEDNARANDLRAGQAEPPGYAALGDRVTGILEAAEQAAFDAVLATFSQHAEHWIGEVEGWAKSEQG